MRFLVIIIFTSCLLVDCKKKYKQYEEDPEQSYKSPKSRFLGRWHLQQYTFSTNDIVPALNNAFQNRFNVRTFQMFYSYHDDTKEYFLTISTTNPFGARRQGFDEQFITFKLDDQLITRDSFAADTVFKKWLLTPFLFTSQNDQSWRITRLFGNSLNIVLDTDSGQFKMSFVKEN